MPKISVITAAYNHVKFIRQSVESVQAQTYRDFEHIVVDDGSSDGTAEILKSFVGQITYIRQDNRGAHAAINEGIRRSSGDYIAIIDSDDAWLPNKLERQIEAIEKSPEAGMVYSLAYFINSKGEVQDLVWLMGTPFDDPNVAFEELLEVNRIPIVTALVKRSCIEEVGFFSETLKALSDWDMWLRISAKWSIIFIPEKLALYRVHENNAWHGLLKSGRVSRERLLLLRNATAAMAGTDHESNESRDRIRAAFGNRILYTSYEYCRRHQYGELVRYLLFALKLHPLYLRDVVFAARIHPTLFKKKGFVRVVPKLVLGERSIRDIKHFLI